jgi:putative transposase
MVTRRCSQRQFLLRADQETNEAVLYCLGVAATKHGIELHGVTAMSNTLCINCRDVEGVGPTFRQYLMSLLARFMNVHRSRWEAFWSSDEPSVVELIDAEAELGQLVYNLTDPVRQHLVDKVHNWPGVSSLRYQLSGKPIRVKRPKKFFRKDGTMPDEVELRFVPPPSFAHMEQETWSKLLLDRVSQVEAQAADERGKKGTRIAGRKAVLRRSPYSYPKTLPPRRNLNPRVACRDKRKRLAALDRMKRFQFRYGEALKLLAQGVRDVVFPAGTWQLPRLGVVRCEPAPT